MGVGLCEELHASGLSQCLETLHHFRSESLELLYGSAGNGEGHLELLAVCLDEVGNHAVHREVAPGRNAAHNGAVFKIVKIMIVGADVKETVKSQSVGLMYLEVQTNAFSCHIV